MKRWYVPIESHGVIRPKKVVEFEALDSTVLAIYLIPNGLATVVWADTKGEAIAIAISRLEEYRRAFRTLETEKARQRTTNTH